MEIYISFGQVHVHKVNGKTFDKDCLALIKAQTELEGRNMAFKVFGASWFTSYTTKPDMKFFRRGVIPLEGTS